ncbi:MAG: PA14 domain-containing protein, partial [Polyangiales bacterium]
YCHRPGGANAGFDARFNTPFFAQRFVWTAVRNDLGNPGTVVIYPGDPVLSAAWQRSSAVGPIAMPPLAKALVEQPAADLLAYWIQRIKSDIPRAGLGYEYYELMDLEVLPNFDALTPTATGTVSTADLSMRQREDDFAFRFRGYLRIEVAGSYTFYTTSDDGSQLLLEGDLVVDNDGLHAATEQSGSVTLSSGYHPIEIRMFERGDQQVLTTSWAGPDTGENKVSISSSVLFLEVPTVTVNHPPVLSGPGDQSDEQGDPVSLALIAADEDGDALYFDAAGLPEGLSVDHESGRISGTVAVPGVHMVTASASDGPEVSVVTFQWLVTETEPTPDAGVPDGGLPDGGLPDAGNPDAGVPDAGEPDGGTQPGGGGCAVQSGGAPIDMPLLIVMLALLPLRRRRTRA